MIQNPGESLFNNGKSFWHWFFVYSLHRREILQKYCLKRYKKLYLLVGWLLWNNRNVYFICIIMPKSTKSIYQEIPMGTFWFKNIPWYRKNT